MEGSSLRRRTVTVTRNSALGTSPTTSALGRRYLVLPASLVCFCPASIVETPFSFSILGILLLDLSACGYLLEASTPRTGGGFPDERKLIRLFSMSNQNGAPMTMAKAVRRIPRTFKAPAPIPLCQARASLASLDHPIGGVLTSRISSATCCRETSWLADSAGAVD